MFTFGSGQYGQLGHISLLDELRPRLVGELWGATVTQVACGRSAKRFSNCFDSWLMSTQLMFLSCHLVSFTLQPATNVSFCPQSCFILLHFTLLFSRHHTLVLVGSSNKIYSFGRGEQGQLGNVVRMDHQTVPLPVQLPHGTAELLKHTHTHTHTYTHIMCDFHGSEITW